MRSEARFAAEREAGRFHLGAKDPFGIGHGAGSDEGTCREKRVRKDWKIAARASIFTVALSLPPILTSCAGHSASDTAERVIPLPPPPPPIAPAAPAVRTPAVAAKPPARPPATPQAASPAAPKKAASVAPQAIAPATVAKARLAMQDITKLNQLFTEEMATTNDPKVQGAIYADFEKKYMAALGSQGLSLNTYLHVLAVAAKDPGTAKQLYAPDTPNPPKAPKVPDAPK
ncbi:MAG TPA: hypothetical protein VMA37_02915 [Acetobacteraceae bacterium]|nr:hypothetical protein [Acetobacteraceae bacterium]